MLFKGEEMKRIIFSLFIILLISSCVMTGGKTSISTSTDYISSTDGSFKKTLTDKYWWTPKSYQFTVYDSAGSYGRTFTVNMEDFDEVFKKGCELVVKDGTVSVFVYSTKPVDKEYVEVAFLPIDNSDGIVTIQITMLLEKHKITKPEESNREYAYQHYRQYSFDGTNMKLIKESFTDGEMREYLVRTGKISK